MFDEIKSQTETALRELLSVAKLKQKDLFVIGCSTSEVVGGRIGKNGSIEAAQAIFEIAYDIIKENGLYLAVQCCEHLNRAIILEQEAAELYRLEPVNAVPHQHAGGAFATTAYSRFEKPVAVERIAASAGIDIGDTLIGMHLKPVAVPVRISINKIGEAHLVLARTRPRYIGGERARYDENLM